MSSVSVREFSYNPSAMFSRVEQAEAIEVTRHGKVIAVLLPGAGGLGRYSSLVTRDLIARRSATQRPTSPARSGRPTPFTWPAP